MGILFGWLIIASSPLLGEACKKRGSFTLLKGTAKEKNKVANDWIANALNGSQTRKTNFPRGGIE